MHNYVCTIHGTTCKLKLGGGGYHSYEFLEVFKGFDFL